MLERVLADWPLKLLALVIAFALWVAITGENRAVKDVNLPLEVELGENLILASPPVTAVTVRLQGPETLIRRLEPVGLAVRVDLRNAPPGERDVQLTEANVVGLPGRVNVTLFDPERVRLTIDRRSRRELPVIPDLVGKPPEGYFLYRVLARPEAVWVEGPESALATLTELHTDPIRLDHTRSFVQSVGAVPDLPHVRVVDPRPLEVRVIIDVPPADRTFEDVPVGLASQADEASVSPATLRVTVTGPPALLDRLQRSQIRAVADVGKLQPGGERHRVKVEASFVDLSEEQLWRLGVKSIHPGTVSVHLSNRSVPG